MSFNKRAIKATEQNHNKVLEDLNSIIHKYDQEEAKQLRGLSPEMIA